MDWWAFGVLLFEMVAGYPPFYDEEITATYKKILAGRMAFPAHVSVTCRDLIRRLLKACHWLLRWADSATDLDRADVCCAKTVQPILIGQMCAVRPELVSAGVLATCTCGHM